MYSTGRATVGAGVASAAILGAMPSPLNERQALEEERAELPPQIAAYLRQLAAITTENTTRREMLDWQIRRPQNRRAEVAVRPAAIRAQGR